MAKLGMYIQQVRGVSYKPADVREETDSFAVPILRANNIDGGMLNFDDLVFVDSKCVKKEQMLRQGDILICASSGSKKLVGKAAHAEKDFPYSFGAFCKVIRTEEPLQGYIGHFFQSPYYREKISQASEGANINNIRSDDIDSLEIDIPNQEECCARVAVLDKLSHLIQKRKEQVKYFEELVKSQFIEMFGDPMTNSKGYQIVNYGDVFELNAGGTPSKQKSEYWENGDISWIGSNMCQNEILYENDGRYITEQGLKNSSARVFPVDTVLVALVGATIGKTAILKFETTTNQNVLGIRGIRESGYTPEFVFHYTQGLYPKFMEIADGGFAMASKGFISSLPIPVVDLQQQKKFSSFVEQTDKSKFRIKESLENLENCYKALLQKYFG